MCKKLIFCYTIPLLDGLIPLKPNYGLRIPSDTESGIFQDWLGWSPTKTKDLANLPAEFDWFFQGEGSFPSVLHKAKPVLAKIAFQSHNESVEHEETLPNCQIDLDWPEKPKIRSLLVF